MVFLYCRKFFVQSEMMVHQLDRTKCRQHQSKYNNSVTSKWWSIQSNPIRFNSILDFFFVSMFFSSLILFGFDLFVLLVFIKSKLVIQPIIDHRSSFSQSNNHQNISRSTESEKKVDVKRKNENYCQNNSNNRTTDDDDAEDKKLKISFCRKKINQQKLQYSKHLWNREESALL